MGIPTKEYYEDLSVGDEFVSPGRTVTEADIVAFMQGARPKPQLPDLEPVEIEENPQIKASKPGVSSFLNRTP